MGLRSIDLFGPFLLRSELLIILEPTLIFSVCLLGWRALFPPPYLPEFSAGREHPLGESERKPHRMLVPWHTLFFCINLFNKYTQKYASMGLGTEEFVVKKINEIPILMELILGDR